MKKTLFILAFFICIAGILCAQIPEGLNVNKIEEEGKTENGLPYTITIEYLPATGEAFFTFTTPLFPRNLILRETPIICYGCIRSYRT